MKIGIIGAGMSGLVAARRLADAGHAVVIFEKSRGTGGRMATRRIDGGIAFDHGAQYFTARDPLFRDAVSRWMQAGLIQRWPLDDEGHPARFAVLGSSSGQTEERDRVERFVGTPTMNAVCKHLAEGLDIRKQSRVSQITAVSDRFACHFESDAEPETVECLVCTAPPEQGAALLKDFTEVAESLRAIPMAPCWAVMLALESPLDVAWQGAFVHDSLLTWVARNGTKPSREGAETLVLHAGPEWTEAHWERDPDEVAAMIVDEFRRISGIELPDPAVRLAHRWKYALPMDRRERGPIEDPGRRLFAGGDWACGSRVEGAYLAGWRMAESILALQE